MKKPNILFIGLLCAIICSTHADISEKNGEQTPVVEEAAQKIHALQPGEKEYLSPNLIGVQNIAVTNIPITINFINIIDAYREVVDGVRYEIVLNAVNTTDNNTEIICRIVVLEKPWLTTIWGDKVRLLQESNCTSEELPDASRNRKALEEKYETNAIFSGSRNELTADDMLNLESQIVGPSKNPQMTRQRAANPLPTTTESIIVSTTEQVSDSEDVVKQTNSPIQSDSSSENKSNEVETVVASSSESTTTEKIPELSDNEKKWLDDFLSIGSYNFEASQANKNAQSANDGAQESDKRKSRSAMPGGQTPLKDEELKQEEENISKSVAKLASGDKTNWTVEKCHSGTKQVVAGTIVKLDCDLVDSKTGKKDRCTISLWSQPWLKEDGYEISFDCKDAPKTVHRYSRSVNDRRKRSSAVLGGASQLEAEELKQEEENISKSVAKLASGDKTNWTVGKCHSGTKQVVAGSLIKLDCDMVDSKTGKKDRCTIALWSQPWLEDGNEISFDCKDAPKTVHRYSRSVDDRRQTRSVLVGGPGVLDADELQKEVEIFSNSLTKLASGDSTNLKIEKCDSGTKQVVAGSLVKLYCDMVDSKTGKKDRCTISLWSQPWLKENCYEMTLDCKNTPKTVQRFSRSLDNRTKKGGPKPLTDFELKEQEGRVAQSLAKISSGDGPSYKISRAFNGTKQTVAGSLVKIFAELIDENTGAKENCTVSLWSRPWIPIDGYEVTFEFKDKQKSVHRHSRSIEYSEKKTNKKSHRSLDKAEHLFQKFQIKYQKQYLNSMERQMRLRIFKHNLKLIHDLNKNEMGSAKYGITEFADMTTTEYRDRTGLLSREESNSVRSPAKIPDVELPKEFDWREKGAISKVKNQGNCGSCWAFSVTGNIEGLHAVKTGKLEEYSEQELLDCDTIDSACNGGLPDDAYKAIENIGGLELESEYPYQAKKSQCHFNSSLSHVKISGAVDLPKNETEMAKWLIVNGPISIGINANAMQFYRGGVSHPWKMLCSKKNLDHGVLIVGYGISEYPTFKKTLPYWIVKNSWGPKWGEQGYYRVYRGDNTCGVSEMATSAVLAS
ncbi:putative cysteine proteinase CG12163 isoform X3 [Episyrphus balteatus]|uniref:putative cysteine proteinase CG12163 isoform X3 n=1 Tax=Episyrphus balteatus TaxID=286459 RepID=UPI00248525C8|nr:putative cysteine proteinase CG12163 isoform X3 [Episyrphus balteatus]